MGRVYYLHIRKRKNNHWSFAECKVIEELSKCHRFHCAATAKNQKSCFLTTLEEKLLLNLQVLCLTTNTSLQCIQHMFPL